MKRAAILLTALFFLQSPTSAQDQCTISGLDSRYRNCRAASEQDPKALLSCIQEFVTACEALTETVVDELLAADASTLPVPEAEPDQPLRRKRLTSDDPNYFSIAAPRSPDLGDVNHAEFYVSIKYPLFDQTEELASRRRHLGALAGAGDWSHLFKPDRVLFHYNGLYDFYMLDDGANGQYDSSPIISRRQNPGVSLEYDWGDRSNHLTTRYGYYHESNGQQLEEEDRARFEFLAQRDSEEYALSRVSRGWDYWMLRLENSNYSRNSAGFGNSAFERQGTGFWHWSAELRWYRPDQIFGLGGDREDDIWWEEGRRVAIEDFDGLRLMAEYSPDWLNWGEFGLTPRLELKTSQEEPFKRVSYRASTGIYLNTFNLSLFYFDGYGRDPSTYHLRSRYWGLGLELR